MREMGVRGPGLWSDDTACDVRGIYREALEDGLNDVEARTRVESTFALALSDADSATVVWLALAGAQSRLGRLEHDVRDRALAIIDDGSNLLQWEEDPTMLKKRRAVLAKFRETLLGPQPDRKQVRRPTQRNTTLVPGDVVAHSAPSGRIYLLAVRTVVNFRYGSYPIVRLLQFEGTEIPDADDLAALPYRPDRILRIQEFIRREFPGGDALTIMRDRTEVLRAIDPPGEPQWNKVGGAVMHKRGSDFADCGFYLAGQVPAPSLDEQERLARPSLYSWWPSWRRYLDKQDANVGHRATS